MIIRIILLISFLVISTQPLRANESVEEALSTLQHAYVPPYFEAVWDLRWGDVRHQVKWQRFQRDNGLSYESMETLGKLKTRVHRWQKHLFFQKKDRMLEKLLFHFFLNPFPVPKGQLSDYYQISLEKPSQSSSLQHVGIRFMPKQTDRSAHLFWLNKQGMVVGYAKESHQGEILKSFQLVSLTTWTQPPQQMVETLLKPNAAANWHGLKPETLNTKPDWQFNYLPAGFELVDRFSSPRKTGKEHWMFSDGLSEFSVFFVEKRKKDFKHRRHAKGVWGTQFWKGTAEGKKVIVVGDLPTETIERIVDGITAIK